MTEKDTLARAIQKAIEGGWLFILPFILLTNYNPEGKTLGKIDLDVALKHYADIIFNHDFAKALWGEELDESEDYYLTYTVENDNPAISNWDTGFSRAYWYGKNWQYHLQQMVIADDPLEYLNANM